MGDIRFYVYVDKKLSDRKVFYVGKGGMKRVRDPWRKNLHWLRVVSKERGYLREIVFETQLEKSANSKEIELIKFYGRKNLVNFTDGGEGQRGVKPSLETRLKMSFAGKGKKKPQSRINYLKTRVYSDETRRKISLANSKRNVSLGTRLKMRNAKLGRRLSLESRRKVSESLIGNQRARKKGGLYGLS